MGRGIVEVDARGGAEGFSASSRISMTGMSSRTG